MCIFCKIIDGELPSYKIYEDEKTFAFLDVRPSNPGHILVIPKKHCKNIEEASDDDLGALMMTIKKMGKLLKDKLGAKGYNVTENNDPISGQKVPHLHFHLIPRHEGDGHAEWPQREYKPGEAEEIIKKLQA
jgi:histidine triad (HIT) family protein